MNDEKFTDKIQPKPKISVHEVLFKAGLITKPRYDSAEGFSLSQELIDRIGQGHVGNEQRYKDVANALYLMALQAIAAKTADVDSRMGLDLSHSQFKVLYDPRETAQGILGQGYRTSEERIAEGGDFLVDVYRRIQTALEKVLESKRSQGL